MDGIIRTGDVLLLWGKARPLDAEQAVPWHPLVYHLLDVAASAQALLEGMPLLSFRLAAVARMPEEDFCRLATWLAALHDLGKFTFDFQAQVLDHLPEELRDRCRAATFRSRHDAAGFRRARTDLRSAWCIPQMSMLAWQPLFAAATGHHGGPPELIDHEPDGDGALRELMATYIAELDRLLGARPRPPGKSTFANRLSYPLNGLISLADWVGSQQAFFPYRRPDLDLAAYWQEARSKAAAAVRKLGLVQAPPPPAIELAAIVGGGRKPRPLQEWALATPFGKGPTLYQIQDLTGSGKTEAALILLARLLLAGRAAGAYFALPTMATANAMHDRLQAKLDLLFPGGAGRLALLHGRAELTPLLSGLAKSASGDDGRGQDGLEPAEDAAAQWLRSDRRLGFLMELGAGTIDQALLSVLPARFQTVRRLGLMQRVLIIDEAHAYDAFTGQELVELLRQHAMLGGDAIVLSATLSMEQRRRMAEAFAGGAADFLGEEPRVPPVAAKAYPSASRIGAGEAVESPIQAATGRELCFSRLADEATALAFVRAQAEAGHAVAYIRNTVDDAIAAARELADLAPLLFHARFALIDRLLIEREAVRLFGPASSAAERAAHRVDGRKIGRVLIATQVAEQSLDLDFDEMASDLAPIDLLLQRAGRLRRHARPGRVGIPELRVVCPEPGPGPGADWLASTMRPTGAVYRRHDLMYLTAREILRRGRVELAADTPALIEAVYGDAKAEELGALQALREKGIGQAQAQRGVARLAVTDLGKGYLPTGAWEDDEIVATRLSDVETLTLRLGRRASDGSVLPWAAGAEGLEDVRDWQLWRLSEVQVRKSRIQGEAEGAGPLAERVGKVKESWSRRERSIPLVVLTESQPGIWTGEVAGRNGSATVAYSPRRGLMLI